MKQLKQLEWYRQEYKAIHDRITEAIYLYRGTDRASLELNLLAQRYKKLVDIIDCMLESERKLEL